MAETLLKDGKLEKKTVQKVEQIRNRMEKQQKIQDNPFKKAKKSAAERLKIPIEKSRNVYGVSDPTGKLERGTVFFQPTIRGQPVVLHTGGGGGGGRVVVAKNPCYHPGDIRVLRCVDEPECRHLVDCIVFPTTGQRPHPDEIAGSDLDGDKYFVCWDEELVPKSEVAPCQYPAAKPKKKDKITREDCVRYFSRYSNATVGKLDHLFEYWADAKGVNSPECREIAALFSRAIDAAKTGEKVKISKHLGTTSEPRPKGSFVWLKLLERAKVFESDRYLEAEMTAKVDGITEEDMLEILKNRESRCSEYRLFRFLYKWCENAGKLDSILQYSSHLDFTKFTSKQVERYRVMVDVPGVNLKRLLNPLHQSKILSDKDIGVFSKSHPLSKNRWQLLYQADGEELSWKILDNVFRSPIQKLVNFQFLVGGLKWVISLLLAISLESHEVITIDEHALESATAYVSESSGPATVSPLMLQKGYSFSWKGDRLDIYTGSKRSTFICLRKDDAAKDRPVMSVALDRFQGKPPTRIQREKILAIEVFCLYDSDDTGHTVRQISSPAVENESAATAHRQHEEFRKEEADFPRLDATPEELLSEIEKVYKELSDSLENGEVQRCQLEALADRMVAAGETNEEECHEIACYLEFFLAKAPTAAFTSPQRYKQLVLSLLTGLRYPRFDTVICEVSKTTLMGRIRRTLDTMWNSAVQFSLEDISEILHCLLLGNDYNTACGVLRLFRAGHFPLSGWTFHPNASPYGLHFVSLVTLEALEEVKQATLAQTRKPPIRAQATPRDETEETFTLLVERGVHSFRRGEGVALSYSHVFKREYVAEVREVTGNMLTVSFSWPSGISYANLKQAIATAKKWQIFPFPSLVSFKRVLTALNNLHRMHSSSEALFEQIVGSFTCLDDVSDPKASGSESSDYGCGVQHTKGNRLEAGASAAKACETASRVAMNESQEAAVNEVLKGRLPVTLIQGPPGTGKTVTCAEIVRRWLQLDSSEPILVVAETNEGVDNLMKKIAEHLPAKPGEIVRVGSSGWNATRDLQPFTLESLYRERAPEKKAQFDKLDKKYVKKVINAARVICSTCISAGSALLEGHTFSRVLVDEASQATEPVILVALSHGCKQLVLVGDDQQLPPMVQCELASELSMTLFTRMRSAGMKVRMLDIQYRMHPTIALFPSRTFYGGKLRNGVSSAERKPPSGFDWPSSEKPVAFISMSNSCLEKAKGSSKLNCYEAERIDQLIRDLLKANDVSCSQIGVVTPYRAQVERISSLISEGVSVRTVDGFQGQERDVIVFSAVRCNEDHYVGFLDDAKRINVLLTRARRGLVVVGNRSTLSSCKTWEEWICWADDEGLVREEAAAEVGRQTDHHPGDTKGRRDGRGNPSGRRRGRAPQGPGNRYRDDMREYASRGSSDTSQRGSRGPRGSTRRGRGAWQAPRGRGQSSQ